MIEDPEGILNRIKKSIDFLYDQFIGNPVLPKMAEFDSKRRTIIFYGGTGKDPMTFEDAKRLCPEALNEKDGLWLNHAIIGGCNENDQI